MKGSGLRKTSRIRSSRWPSLSPRCSTRSVSVLLQHELPAVAGVIKCKNGPGSPESRRAAPILRCCKRTPFALAKSSLREPNAVPFSPKRMAFSFLAQVTSFSGAQKGQSPATNVAHTVIRQRKLTTRRGMWNPHNSKASGDRPDRLGASFSSDVFCRSCIKAT